MFMNRVVYTVNREKKRSATQLFVSESEFDRSVSTIVKGPKETKLVIFPNTVRQTRAGAFAESPRLKSVVLNEGLEKLERPSDDQHSGVFHGTGIEQVMLPKTLLVLGDKAFQNCRMLKRAIFSGESRLEEIGASCFNSSEIQGITIPSSVTTF